MSNLRSIVLFMPARNVSPLIGPVVVRVPTEIGGHPVEVVVVDDDSKDTTATSARIAGADVVYGENVGIGAAVRVGLDDAVRRDPIAVAFCNGDGSYDPAELEALVMPILDGQADYVVGSRFGQRSLGNALRRRLGDRVLSSMVRTLAGVRVTDGQSGFRALSREAAMTAEIVHDYSYAQVLTLDLVGKGFRYAEVPITSGSRRGGRSLLTLVPYLGHVLPASWRLRAGRPNALRAPQTTTV
jgi:glycosyltransferase involved in cell wall biosynthesis